jgi:hypothetical protein
MTVWPNGTRTKPDISTPYGGYAGHNGCDFINFDINCATDRGAVVYAGWNPSGAGYEVRIEHADYISRYLHNTPNLLVNFGTEVSEGQALGIQGMTGDATGKHLHYEVWPGGNINNRCDPVPYLAARVGSSAADGNSKPITETDDLVTPRPFTTDGGKTFQIMFEDGYTKPLIDVRDGLPMKSAVVKALNKFLRYDKGYYPNGVEGAAVMAPDVAAQFANALKRP